MKVKVQTKQLWHLIYFISWPQSPEIESQALKKIWIKNDVECVPLYPEEKLNDQSTASIVSQK